MPAPDKEPKPLDGDHAPPEKADAATTSFPPNASLFRENPSPPAGETFTPPPDLVGHPRYLLLERIGSGGMGTVYKAVHLLMDRVVALKVIHQGLVGSRGSARRFRREIRAAARLSHPNIVVAYDADRINDTHFLVMELVEGLNLEELAAIRTRLSVAHACDYVRQAALGLQHAFERGMVHRDIKPHNLMLTPEGEIKILDFGLSRFLSEVAGADATPSSRPPGEGRDEEGDAVGLETPSPYGSSVTNPALDYPAAGTPDYMAPEEALNPRSADIRADIYSLGCTLYRFLSGRVPFPGGSVLDKVQHHLTTLPDSLAELRPGLPRQLVEVVEKMMTKEPADRYQTPAGVVQALAPFLASGVFHVLVLEGDADTRQGLAHALEGEGYTVSQAAHGDEALDMLRAGPQPNLILWDLATPTAGGCAFLRQRERDPALAAIPVVIVSAEDPGQARSAALGAAGNLQKPVAPHHVADHVRWQHAGAHPD